VACGNRQDYYMEYAETFAPTVAKQSLRTLFSLAVEKGLLIHEKDVKAAFLHGKIQDIVHIELPAFGYDPAYRRTHVGKSNRAF
jgi:Reverse transcriptase (RNA-dependent DNA polymerase)